MSRFEHDALLYRSGDDFLAQTVPFVREGVEAGEPVMVALVPERLGALDAALGSDAAGVRFVDMAALGRNPARILPAWHTFVSETGGRPARGIGEPVWPGRGDDEVDECMRHERLLNVAFEGGAPFKLVCPYDARAFDDGVMDAVHGCHGHDPGGGDLLEGTLPPAPPDARQIGFERGDLSDVRRFAAECAHGAGLGAEKTLDFTLAMSEIAANSIYHGGGRGTARAWADDGSVFCEVIDAGRIDDPLAGRIPPNAESPTGRGLWIVNQIADLVRIRSGADGTVVRVQVLRRSDD